MAAYVRYNFLVQVVFILLHTNLATENNFVLVNLRKRNEISSTFSRRVVSIPEIVCPCFQRQFPHRRTWYAHQRLPIENF